MGEVPFRGHAHLDVDLYTPLEPFEWEGVQYKGAREILEMLRMEYGGWKVVARVCRISSRQWRRIRNGDPERPNAAISMMVLDKILTRTGRPHLVERLPWFTVDEIVKMGIWKPHNPGGLVRYGQDDDDRGNE